MSRNLREAAQRLKDATPEEIQLIAAHDWDMIRDVASGYIGTTSPASDGQSGDGQDVADLAKHGVTEAQVKYMTERFLGWSLPENFNPDDGISFDPIMNKGHPFERRRTPTGTNLFDANQAEAMVRYLVEGLPE